jgi:hypothetical protein
MILFLEYSTGNITFAGIILMHKPAARYMAYQYRKKSFVLLIITILFQLRLAAQFPVGILPIGTLGVGEADTLLNTRAILMKAGIRSYSYETSPHPEKMFDSKTVYINKQGNTSAVKLCDSPANGNTVFCILDTFLYDDQGRLSTVINIDKKGTILQNILEYPDESVVRYKIPYSTAAAGFDTLTGYKYFNEKGQIVTEKQVLKGGDTAYTLFFYDKNSRIDSVQYPGSGWATVVFKRNRQKNYNIIKASTATTHFKWTYNLAGQCFEAEYTTIQHTGDKAINWKARYYYNPDGTIAKITEQRGSEPVTLDYTYSK